MSMDVYMRLERLKLHISCFFPLSHTFTLTCSLPSCCVLLFFLFFWGGVPVAASSQPLVLYNLPHPPESVAGLAWRGGWEGAIPSACLALVQSGNSRGASNYPPHPTPQPPTPHRGWRALCLITLSSFHTQTSPDQVCSWKAATPHSHVQPPFKYLCVSNLWVIMNPFSTGFCRFRILSTAAWRTGKKKLNSAFTNLNLQNAHHLQICSPLHTPHQREASFPQYPQHSPIHSLWSAKSQAIKILI